MVQFASAQCTVSVRQEGTFSDNNTTVTLVLEGGQPIEWVNTTTGSTFTGYSIQTSEPGDYVVTAHNYDTYNYPEACSTTYTLDGPSSTGCDFIGYINYAGQAADIVMNQGGYLLFEDLNGNQVYRDGSLLLDSSGNIAAENYIGIITEVFGGSATMVYGSAGAYLTTVSGGAPIAFLKFTDADKNVLTSFSYSTECDVCSVEIQQDGEFSEHNNTVALVALGSGNLAHEWTNVETGATYTGWSITISEPGLYRLKTTDLATGDVCGDFIDVVPYIANPGMYFEGTKCVTIPIVNPFTIESSGDYTFEVLLNPDYAYEEEDDAPTVLTLVSATGGSHRMYLYEVNAQSSIVKLKGEYSSYASIEKGECSMVSLSSTDEDYWMYNSGVTFVNGTKVGGNRPSLMTYTPLSEIIVGYNPEYQYSTYKGIIKEIRFWNYSRTKAEINAYANVELTGNEPGLVGYWKLDERDGQEITDYSPLGNDGYRGMLPTEDASDPETIESCSIESIAVTPLSINYAPGEVDFVTFPIPVGNMLNIRNEGDFLRNINVRTLDQNGNVKNTWGRLSLAPGEEQYFLVSTYDPGTYTVQIIKDGTVIGSEQFIKQ